MKVIHTADLHGGLTRYGHPTPRGGNSRIDDFGACLNRFVDLAISEAVDLAVFAGDIFHGRRPGPQELGLFSAALDRLRSAGIAVVIVPGNHDGPSTVGDWRTNTFIYLEALHLPGVTIFLRPNDEVVDTPSGRVRVVGLPYPHKRAFDEVLAHIPDPEDRVIEAAKRWQAIIEERSTPEDRSIPNIAVGHLTVVGATTSTEATMRIGWDVTVGVEAFDNFDLAALGHIHRQQRLSPKVFYAGSPEYIDFGEEGNPKGFMLYEVEPGKDPVASVADSAPRPMFTLTFDGRAAGPRWAGVDKVKPGGFVRLVILLDAPDPSRVAKVVSEARRAADPHFLKTEVRIPERVREGRPEIDSDLDVGESLRRWLVSQGHPEEPALTAGRELVASLTE